MTAQDIHNKVEAFKQLTEFLKEQNPEIREVRWVIEDVPYDVFKNYINELNASLRESEQREEILLCGKLYTNASWAHNHKGCGIQVWSVPVKVTTTVQVIEKLEETTA